MTSNVRVVVAGAGRFGREHLRALSQIPGVGIGGVADLSESAARQAAEAYDVSDWSVDTVELVDRVRPDGLIVATPGHTHVALATSALALGISVLVEKPVALTAADAASLAEAESASSGFVLPGHILRFSQPHRKFVQMAQSAAIGRILSVSARRHRDDSHAVRYPDIDPVLMTMIHDIDLSVWITGAEVAKVFAARSPVGAQRSNTTATAIDTRGAGWHLSTAWTYPTEVVPPDRIEVVGEGGAVELEVGVHIRQFGAVIHHIDLQAPPLDDPLLTELSYFVQCIRSGERPGIVTMHDALTGLKAAEAVIASMQTGEAIRP